MPCVPLRFCRPSGTHSFSSLPRTCVLGCNIPPLRGCAASLSARQWTSRSKAEVRIRAGFSAVPLGLMTNWSAQVGGRGRPPHTGITQAFAPPPKALPADPAQSRSSYLPHRRRRIPGRRSSRNKCRIYPPHVIYGVHGRSGSCQGIGFSRAVSCPILTYAPIGRNCHERIQLLGSCAVPARDLTFRYLVARLKPCPDTNLLCKKIGS